MYADYDDYDEPTKEEYVAEWIGEQADYLKSQYEKHVGNINFADLWCEWYIDDMVDAHDLIKEIKCDREQVICYLYIVDRKRFGQEMEDLLNDKDVYERACESVQALSDSMDPWVNMR